VKYVPKKLFGLTYEEFQNLSQRLEGKGFRRVDVDTVPKEPKSKCYHVTSYTSDEVSFEGLRKFNVTYLEIGKARLLSS
jgi:hypothetical protein